MVEEETEKKQKEEEKEEMEEEKTGTRLFKRKARTGMMSQKLTEREIRIFGICQVCKHLSQTEKIQMA
jgi:hypothetical protein